MKNAGDKVRLLGTVNTVRGTYDFQGRRFDIQRDGRIQFQGNTEINPRLDIIAQRLISGVEAQVHVRGTALKPELTLTSKPPLDEADILSLIIFNQPANALGEGEQVSLAQRAGALASGFVASSLAKFDRRCARAGRVRDSDRAGKRAGPVGHDRRAGR